jgi:hypothetical protein
MGAGPAERCLQRLVQAIKPEGEGNLKPTQDQRFDAVEG